MTVENTRSRLCLAVPGSGPHSSTPRTAPLYALRDSLLSTPAAHRRNPSSLAPHDTLRDTRIRRRLDCYSWPSDSGLCATRPSPSAGLLSVWPRFSGGATPLPHFLLLVQSRTTLLGHALLLFGQRPDFSSDRPRHQVSPITPSSRPCVHVAGASAPWWRAGCVV
jgi:hypothetical protein